METYFVYPTNPMLTSLDDDADAEPVKIASMEDISTVPELNIASMEDISTVPDLNQCQLVKLPAKTRRQTPSPFSDVGGSPHSPAIMDMVKPQVPDGAWKTSPSLSSPRLSQVSPEQPVSEEGGEEQDVGQRNSAGLFIAQEPQQAMAEHQQQRTRKSKKCVVS